MMWRTRNIYFNILKGRYPVEARFTKNMPEWKWFDDWGNFWLSRLLWVGIYTWLYIVFAPSLWFLLLLPIHIAMGNYKTDNTSKNLFKIDWLMLGEGYHNNHHLFPSRTNFASKKGEFDLCYPIIYLLGKLKIIKPRIEH